MPRCGFTYSLVAESSAWFLLLWPLLISAPSVGSVADCFLFALRNGVQFSRAEFSNSIPVMFFSHPVTESLPSLCPCQVSAVKYLTLDPIWLERCRSEAGQPRQRNLRHKGWETQCICAAVSWGDLQQGVSFPRALLAHSQIIGGHLENLQNTDNWGKMLDNGSFILFFFFISCLVLFAVNLCSEVFWWPDKNSFKKSQGKCFSSGEFFMTFTRLLWQPCWSQRFHWLGRHYLH